MFNWAVVSVFVIRKQFIIIVKQFIVKQFIVKRAPKKFKLKSFQFFSVIFLLHHKI